MIPSDVAAQWKLSGSAVKLGSGLINDTYCVADHLVLQRINNQVFAYPKSLVSNYLKVYEHVRDLVPKLVPTVTGEFCYEDNSGCFWKCMVYHPSRNFQTLPDEMVYSAGRAFGLFLRRLSNCDAQLEPVIPNFHQFDHYLDDLEFALDRAEEQVDRTLVVKCREIVNTRAQSGERQIIHGDCKINNLLFDLDSDKVVRIVDADTLMWGYPAWDFGDLVRSIATGRKRNLPLKTRLISVCKGFFEQFPISKEEVEQYAYAPIYMSMMLGVRFLTDHIRGDRYFKVERIGENRNRASEQFEIAEFFTSVYTELCGSIRAGINSTENRASTIGTPEV